MEVSLGIYFWIEKVKLGTKLSFLSELYPNFNQGILPTFQQDYCCVNYQKFGKGNRVLIAFHGFSKNSDDFLLYAQLLENNYTVYAVDLFYHGKTKIDGRKMKSFDKIQLKSFFENFISHLDIDRFSVMGYSMGGRIALFMAEQFAPKMNELYLLAPDGLTTNFWNWMVTNTNTGKALYGFTIKNPAWVGQMANLGMFLKILPPKYKQFIQLNFGTAGMRLRIYRVWKLYQKIVFDKKHLAKIIQNNHIKLKLIVGHKDPVVSPVVCKSFCKSVGKNAMYLEVNAGHDLFKPHVIEYLKNNILFFNDFKTPLY